MLNGKLHRGALTYGLSSRLESDEPDDQETSALPAPGEAEVDLKDVLAEDRPRDGEPKPSRIIARHPKIVLYGHLLSLCYSASQSS